MFTGLIEEVGTITSITNEGKGKRIEVKGKLIFDDLKVDDSVAIEGVCQTVVKINKNVFVVQAIDETIQKTNFASLKIGQYVNLERAVRLSDRLGGHIVQGHIDTTGVVKKIKKESNSYLVSVKFDSKYRKWIIPVGSVCLNGISLTVAKIKDNVFTVAIIPHTWDVTTIGKIKEGDSINVEFDLIGKYIENMFLNSNNNSNNYSNHNDYLKGSSHNSSSNSSDNSILKQFYSQPEY